MSLSAEELERLEAVAKTAGRGEWNLVAEIFVDDEYGHTLCVPNGNKLSTPARAAHIAAFNPSTALALIAELREARSKRDVLAKENRSQAKKITHQRGDLEQQHLRCKYYKRWTANALAKDPELLKMMPMSPQIREVLYMDALVESEYRAGAAERELAAIRGKEPQ